MIVACEANMTEETQQLETAVQNDVHTSSTDDVKPGDNKKEKCRPMTKVHLRQFSHTDHIQISDIILFVSDSFSTLYLS